HTRSYGDWSSDVCSSDLAESHVQYQFSIHSPVVLSEEAEIDEAPAMIGPAGVKAYGSRSVVHHIGKTLVRNTTCVGIRISSRRRSEERRVGKEWRYRLGR